MHNSKIIHHFETKVIHPNLLNENGVKWEIVSVEALLNKFVSNTVRVPNTAENSVTCSNPKCDVGLIKKTCCKCGMYYKLIFCENSTRNMVDLTVVQDETLTLIPNALYMSENNVKKHLI